MPYFSVFPLHLEREVQVVIVLGVVLTFYYLSGLRRRAKLPPGPRRLPIIGNAHQLPRVRPYYGLAEMSKVYGDLMHVDMLGQSIVVVNSRKIAIDLMEKRSSIYSDRPVIPIFEIISMGKVFPMLPYGEDWRKQRGMVARDFSTAYVANYHSLQEREARVLVLNLLQRPETLFQETKLRTGRLIIRVVYGYDVQSLEDPMIAIPLEGMLNFDKGTQPTGSIINIIPALKYFPRWLPGTTYYKTADYFDEIYNKSVRAPYEWCRNNLSTGKTQLPNLCNNVWEKAPNASPDDDLDMIRSVGSLLGGGLDTGISSALTFFMNMILHPDIQRKAQGELDSVVGTDRLPDIKDRPQLPYIRSILAETMRFMPSAPVGLPHAVRHDDIYEGYVIPKGAWIIANIWQMLHDPLAYPDPMSFNPDRFQGDEQAMEDAKSLAFGFGRRACPGRLFAENSLFAVIATTLATCEILPGLDDQGNEVFPSGEYMGSTIIHPEEFSIRLRSRSLAAGALLWESTGMPH